MVYLINYGDGVFELWDYEPRIASDYQTVEAHLIPEQPPEQYEILNHKVEEYLDTDFWMLVDMKEQNGRFAGDIMSKYPGGLFKEWSVSVRKARQPGVQVKEYEKEICLSLPQGRFAVQVPNTEAEIGKLELCRPDVLRHRQYLLLPVYTLTNSKPADFESWSHSLDRLVFEWRELLCHSELSQYNLLSELESNIRKDTQLMSQVKSVARQAMIDIEAGYIMSSEVSSVIVDGREYLVSLKKKRNEGFLSLEDLASKNIFEGANMAPYVELLSVIGEQECTHCTKLGELYYGAKEVFDKRVNPVTSIDQIKLGNPYIAPAIHGYFMGTVHHEVGLVHGKYELNFEYPIQVRVGYGLRPSWTDESQFGGLLFNGLDFSVSKIRVSGNGKITDSVWELPLASASVLQDLHSLASFYRKRRNDARSELAEEDPWGKMAKNLINNGMEFYFTQDGFLSP